MSKLYFWLVDAKDLLRKSSFGHLPGIQMPKYRHLMSFGCHGAPSPAPASCSGHCRMHPGPSDTGLPQADVWGNFGHLIGPSELPGGNQ